MPTQTQEAPQTRASKDFSSASFMLEHLEPRIAPASIVAGNGPDAVNYNTDGTPFILASASPDADIAALFNGSNDHYYLSLTSKDVLSVWNSGSLSQLVSVTSGAALAFFYDANQDGIVEINELSGISIGGGTSMIISGDVNGDIVANLDTKTGDFFATSLISDAQTIRSLQVGGVNGSIAAGGAITNVKVKGVEQILTGSAAGGYTYDFSGGAVGVGVATLDPFAPAPKKAGASISNIEVGTVGQIIAGDGGAGGTGGSVSNVYVYGDTDGFTILAGQGGDPAGGVTSGGAGGKISTIVVKGLSDNTSELINITAGSGANGVGNGKGGAGGSVDSIYIGYEYSNGKIVKSADFLANYVYVAGGTGGTGASGGAGGSLSNINARVAPEGDLLGDEILLRAGNGGDTNAVNGKGGNGGSVNNYFVISNYDGVLNPLPSVYVIGGDGGGGGGATGGHGGSVSNGVVLSKVLTVMAGTGAAGAKTGGNGGSISRLEIAYPGDAALTQNGQPENSLGNIFAQQVILNAGAGGNATTGKAGNGGSIATIAAPDTNLSVLVINGGTAGNGGSSVNGTGGNGGSVTGVEFLSDRDTALELNAAIRAGNGGDGAKKAGNGGGVVSSSFLLTDANINLSSGNGGSTTLKGASGSGGAISNVTLVTAGTVGGNLGAITATSGNGGNAAGKSKAGNGGGISNFTAVAPGDVTATAGNGGSSDSGTAGSGGAISNVLMNAWGATSNATLISGNAGANNNPTKGGNGGAISSVNVLGGNDVSILSGNGSFGGNGGDINTASIGGSVVGLAPSGVVTVAAGNGSTGPKTGGKGGSLVKITAYTSSNAATTSTFTAGNGGDGSGKAGAGGAVSSLTILNGSGAFYVMAGDGGDSTGKGTGGAGGSVSGLSVKANIVAQAIVAGDGGSTALGKKGANGGSVTNVHTFGDIGIRSGQNYGVNTMGGIFAGTGGGGVTAGAAGNVIDITANAISAIVAGRGAMPELVSLVDKIYLNGLTPLATNNDGSFANVNNANFIGGISGDPTAPNADQFKTNNGPVVVPVYQWQADDQPLDGLVAAVVLTSNRNVAPNALLQPNPEGGLQLVSIYN